MILGSHRSVVWLLLAIGLSRMQPLLLSHSNTQETATTDSFAPFIVFTVALGFFIAHAVVFLRSLRSLSTMTLWHPNEVNIETRV